MADQYLLDNAGSEDERAGTEEEEKASAAWDTWSGIVNSTGFHTILKGKIFYSLTEVTEGLNFDNDHDDCNM